MTDESVIVSRRQSTHENGDIFFLSKLVALGRQSGATFRHTLRNSRWDSCSCVEAVQDRAHLQSLIYIDQRKGRCI